MTEDILAHAASVDTAGRDVLDRERTTRFGQKVHSSEFGIRRNFIIFVQDTAERLKCNVDGRPDVWRIYVFHLFLDTSYEKVHFWMPVPCRSTFPHRLYGSGRREERGWQSESGVLLRGVRL